MPIFGKLINVPPRLFGLQEYHAREIIMTDQQIVEKMELSTISSAINAQPCTSEKPHATLTAGAKNTKMII